MTTSTQYQKIKNDPEKYNKEKKRINEYIKNRYATDTEYREKMILYQRMRRYTVILTDEEMAKHSVNSDISN